MSRRRMEARRIPGTGQLAIREWWGRAWSDWFVVDDTIYNRPRPRDWMLAAFGTPWGSPAYRSTVDQLPEPPLGSIPPLPEYFGDQTPVAVTHRLKIDGTPFHEILCGRKRFEWRKDDRGYKEGDVLELRAHVFDEPTDEAVLVRVLYVMREGYGLPHGYVVLSIEPIAVTDGSPGADAPTFTYPEFSE